MTTGTKACNGMRGVQQGLTYHPGKSLDRMSYRTARPSKLRLLFRQVHTIRTRPFALSFCPIISSAVNAGHGARLQWQGGRNFLLYSPKHLKRASACVHTSASASTIESSQIQNTPQDAQSSPTNENRNASASFASIDELHGFQDEAEAEAMLWAYELWLKRENIKGNKGDSWTQKVQVPELTTGGLHVHRESLDCAGKPQLLASVSAPTREQASREARLLLISKLRKIDDWDKDFEAAGYDGCRNFPRLLNRLMSDHFVSPIIIHQQQHDINGERTFRCSACWFRNLDTRDNCWGRTAPRKCETEEDARRLAIRMLVLNVQLLKLGTLEDVFDDLHEVDSKDLERFFEMEALGQFYLKLDGSRDCRANLFLPNKKRLAQMQTTIRAHPDLNRSQLERKAVIRLVSKLKKTGLWTKPIIPAAKVSVDDELMFTMQEARNGLLQAEQIFTKESSRLTGRVSQDESGNPPTTIQVENRSQQLKKNLDERRQAEDAGTIDIRSQHDQLPVIQIRQQVLEIINRHTYSIIAAETGSGKSTQIPQIILDDAIDQGIGGQCNVICVQPRRIAAQILANRVSLERGEVVGDSVGCMVRYDHRGPTNDGGSITYCTTGIMLNILQHQPETLSSLTHIMLDEVHVRDIGIDLIMMLLKRYVDKCRSTGIPVPRIVILSATIDLELFSNYFTDTGPDGKLVPAPYISIPGRQFDVKKHNLDNVLDDLAATYEPDMLSSLLHGSETKSFLDNHYARFENIKNPDIDASNSVMQNSTESSTNLISAVQISEAVEMEDNLIPYGLIAALIFHLLNTTTSGSILVFLPGLAAIQKLEERVLAFTAMEQFDLDFSDEDRFRLFKLHAALPVEMAKLSLPFPEGCRRVFLSTDVAEASVTIPDVAYVIDTGKVNNLVYDYTARSRRLASFWASKASAIQRAGRAGRVQDGEYFFLGTQKCYDNLRKMKSPDIKRAPLEELCLRVKSTAPNAPIIDVLKQALEPPNADAVVQTIKHLKQTRLLDENEKLTNLGVLLDKIPLDPSAGRLVILGVIFQCLEPMLIIAALNGESLFRRPSSLEDSHTIRNKRHKFARQSHCDHISTINAFKAMRAVERDGHSARDYAQVQHLEFHKYTEASSVIKALLGSLKSVRLVPSNCPPNDRYRSGGKSLNINSDCIPLIKALILHAQFPHVAARTPFTTRSYFSKTDEEDLLPLTSAANVLPPPSTRDLVTYLGKQASQKAGEPSMLRENSLVSPLAMCLFGGRMVWKDRMLRMDSWLPLGINMKDPTYTSDEAARSIIELHKAIDKCLMSAYASLNCETQSQQLAREQLFRSLQKAVRATLERDNHRYAVPKQGHWSDQDEHENMGFDQDQSIQDESTFRADEEELHAP